MADTNAHGPEQLRAAQMETAARLRSAGVDIDDQTDPTILGRLFDAVERFESAVRSRGGDLMVDEPPRGRQGEPDDRRFLLPMQYHDESVDEYRKRILAIARAIEEMP